MTNYTDKLGSVNKEFEELSMCPHVRERHGDSFSHSDWLDAIKIVSRDGNDIILPQIHIPRMIKAAHEEITIMLVGIDERVTGEVEDKDRSAEFLDMEIKSIKELEN